MNDLDFLCDTGLDAAVLSGGKKQQKQEAVMTLPRHHNSGGIVTFM